MNYRIFKEDEQGSLKARAEKAEALLDMERKNVKGWTNHAKGLAADLRATEEYYVDALATHRKAAGDMMYDVVRFALAHYVYGKGCIADATQEVIEKYLNERVVK